MEFYGWTDKEDLVMINQSPDVLHTANCQVEADLKDKLIVGLNEMDKWCFSNAALKVDSRGKSLVVKIDNMQSRKIDGAVCSVILQETYNRYKVDLNDYLQ
jgi:phage terminase large subunit-like protein